jgi:hypothetical protein
MSSLLLICCLLTYYVSQAWNLGFESDKRKNYDVESLRTRELRRQLVKNGEDPAEVDQILDKKELKRRLTEIMWDRERLESNERWWAFAWEAFKWVGGLSVVLIAYYAFESICWNVFARNFQILKMAGTAATKGIYSASLFFVLSVILEVVHYWINISVLASWIIPINSSFRILMIPLPQLPVSPKMVGIGDTDSSFNLSPMLFSMVIQFLQRYCQEFAASRMYHLVKETNTKRWMKRGLKEKKAVREIEREQEYQRFKVDKDDNQRIAKETKETFDQYIDSLNDTDNVDFNIEGEEGETLNAHEKLD